MRVLVLGCLLAASCLGAQGLEVRLAGYTSDAISGEVLPNATIQPLPWLFYTHPEADQNLDPSGLCALDAAVTGDCAASDGEGHFKLDLRVTMPPAEKLPTDARGHSVPLFAAVLFRAGEAAVICRVPLNAGATLALCPGLNPCCVMGSAQDRRGRALAGADVTPVLAGPNVKLPQLAAKTDATGRFVAPAPRWQGGPERPVFYDLACGNLVAASAYSTLAAGAGAFLPSRGIAGRDVGVIEFREPAGISLTLQPQPDLHDFQCTLVGPGSEETARRYPLPAGRLFKARLAEGICRLETQFTHRVDSRNLWRSVFPVRGVQLVTLAGGEQKNLGAVATPGLRQVAVRIASAANLPIMGATVLARTLGAQEWLPGEGQQDGTIMVWLPTDPETSIELDAASEDHVRQTFTQKAPREGSEIVLTLEGIARVSVVVQDYFGRPSEQHVYLVRHGSTAHGRFLKRDEGFRAWVEVVCWRDENHEIGIWHSYEEMPPGKYTLFSFNLDDSIWHWSDEELKGGTRTELVWRQAFVPVVVTVLCNGAPWPDSKLSVYEYFPEGRGAWSYVGLVSTDAQGRCTIPLRHEGKFSLAFQYEYGTGDDKMFMRLSKRHFVARKENPIATVDMTIEVEKPAVRQTEKSNLLFDLPPGVKISQVFVQSTGHDHQDSEDYTYGFYASYAEGGAELPRFQPGKYRVLAWCSMPQKMMRPDYIAEFEIDAASVGGIRIEPQRRVLKGRVLGIQPRTVVTLRLSLAGFNGWTPKPVTPDDYVDVAPDGTFTLEAPPLCGFLLCATAGASRGGRMFESGPLPETADIQLSAELGKLVVHLELTGESDMPLVRFLLRDAAGNLICGQPANHVASVESNSAAVINAVPAGTYQLEVQSTLHLTQVVAGVVVKAGETALVVAPMQRAPYCGFRADHEGLEPNESMICVEYLDAQGQVLEALGGNHPYSRTPARVRLVARDSKPGALFVGIRLSKAGVATVRVLIPGYKPLTFDAQKFRELPPELRRNEFAEEEHFRELKLEHE